MATGLWGNPYGTFLLKLNSSFWSFSCSEAGVWPRFHRYLSMVRMATWRVFMTCQCRALVSVAAVSPPSADVCSVTTVLRCRCLYTCSHCLWCAAFRQPKTFYSSSTSRNVYLSVTKDVLSAKPDVVCSFVATLKIKNRWPWPRWSRLPDKDSFANDMTTSKTSTLQFIDCIDDCIEHIRDIINHMYN